jgi:hypothetical protein
MKSGDCDTVRYGTFQHKMNKARAEHPYTGDDDARTSIQECRRNLKNPFSGPAQKYGTPRYSITRMRKNTCR